MALYPIVYDIRKKYIIKKLNERGAYSSVTAVSFEDIGLPLNGLFKAHTNSLVRNNIIYKTENDKYYLNEKYKTLLYK